MMGGRWTVDGRGLYSDFGLVVPEGGCGELAAFPPLKAVAFNEWQEDDGIEADLDSPALSTRSVSLKLIEVRDMANLDGLLGVLSDGAYHDFHLTPLNRTFTLRLVSMPNLELRNALGFVTLRLADDFPLAGYEYVAPSSQIPVKTDYTIDGSPLTDYGVRVLIGTMASIYKSADVRQNLLRDIRALNGVLYDAEGVTYKSRDIKVRCLMRARTPAEFWRNHDALLYDLVRPGLRQLHVSGTATTYGCFYKSCKTDRFFPDSGIWWEFTLTLTLTGVQALDGNYLRVSADTLWLTEQEIEMLLIESNTTWKID